MSFNALTGRGKRVGYQEPGESTPGQPACANVAGAFGFYRPAEADERTGVAPLKQSMTAGRNGRIGQG